MTPKTIQAIHDSIQHWCRMRSDPENKCDRPSWDHCALCRLFYLHGCKGCPVKKKTSHSLCQSTPYWRAFIAWTMAALDERHWHEAANAEIAFLNSLLPQNRAAQQPTNT